MNTLFRLYPQRIAAALVAIAIAGCGGGSDQPQKPGPKGPGDDPSEPSGYSTAQDKLFGYQWHLHNTGQAGAPGSALHGTPGVDLNVLPVWKQGFEGEGVTVAVLDDGLDIWHEDLEKNIAKGLSYDYELDDTDPTPSQESTSHGTSVAGIIAAEKDADGFGGVGVAPKAKLAGFNMLGKHHLAASAATIDAIGRGVDDGRIDISNNSWGNINGSVAANLEVLRSASRNGVNNGRNGKGVIYLFAAGNERYGSGSRYKGSGPGYGWANSDESGIPQVFSICAVDANGVSSYYSNYGANLLVCAPSSGDNKKTPRITTTKPHFDVYTHTFGGTSAATPMVSGVVALMLQANPELTWRDVRLILARTARILPNMQEDPDAEWITTRSINPYTQKPYQYSHIYGFGLVDADAAVKYAKNFISVGKSSPAWWDSGCVNQRKQTIISQSSVIPMSCGKKEIEFVEVEIKVEHPRFRDLKIELTSPSGTRIPLTDYYPYCGRKDAAHCPTSDFGHRYITSVTALLGEPATGTWNVRVTKDQEAKHNDTPVVEDIKLAIR